MKTTRFGLILLAAGLLPFAAAAQKKPSDISIEDFFKRAQYSQMVLSPDGTKLAALTPLKGRDNVALVDLDKRTSSVITSFEKSDATGIFWVNNRRLCLRVTDGHEVSGEAPRFRGLYCINADGTDLRNHSEVDVGGARRSLSPVAYVGTGDDYIMGMRGRSERSLDLYRFNTSTGRYTLLTHDSPGDVGKWVLDRNLVPRVAVSTPPREITQKGRGILLTTTVWHRAGVDAKWEKLWSYQSDDPKADTYDPVAFDYDNETLYVATNKGRDKEAIYAFDTKTRQMGGLLLEHPLIDVSGGLIFSPTQKKLVGVLVNPDKPVIVWTDPERARIQRGIDAAFPKTFNQLTFARDNEKRVLVNSFSDVDAGTYHLYDAGTKKLETIAKQREWLDPNLMAERRFITYKARDGMEIPAWVTIPKGGGKDLPLVVNIHGGPWVRGYSWASGWGRWPEAQFLASRGYVVLEPEPRGSLGYGKKHYFSSFKQWGQTMQDDITDGALHLVKEGMVDKNRMCLHGGSYGGYATLMGLVKDPDLWKCGSAMVAVTDLHLFQNLTESDISQLSDMFQEEFIYRVGDTGKDKAMFDKYSPARNADKIKAKLLLTMGGNDIRVPIAHGVAMNDAMVKAGKPIEYVVYAGEAHGYNKDENVHDQYRRSLKLFDETIGNKR